MYFIMCLQEAKPPLQLDSKIHGCGPVAVAVAVSGGGAVAVPAPVDGLTKRFFDHIQKDFLINA